MGFNPNGDYSESLNNRRSANAQQIGFLRIRWSPISENTIPWTDFVWGAFFKNVFSPEGWPKNPKKL